MCVEGSVFCFPKAQSISISASFSGMINTPEKSAITKSPGLTTEPPIDIGTLKLPPILYILVVIGEVPLHQTWSPYSFNSGVSVQGPSIITPEHPLATIAAATPPPKQACLSSPNLSIHKISPGLRNCIMWWKNRRWRDRLFQV